VTATSTRRLTGLRATAVWLTVSVLVVLGLASAFVVPEDPAALPTWALGIFMLMAASLGAVGSLVVTRQPGNAVGWILWLSSIAVSVSLITEQYTSLAITDGVELPATAFVAWLSEVGLTPAITSIIIIIPLLFPDGRLLTRRWRWAAAFGSLVIAVVLIRNAFAPGPLRDYSSIQNPVGIAAIEALGPIVEVINGPGVVVAAALSVWSSVLRYRRGSPVERAQIRWFGAATAWTLSLFALAIFSSGPLGDIGWIGGIMSLSLVPIAIGIAILRYRLYEIDRIVSRTIGYGLVTGVLVIVFAGAVIGFEAVLAGVTETGGETLAVAGSTLLAFALFQPLRRRIQRAVDRRFDRSRYDGERTSAAFSERLRDEVDLTTVTADLDATVRAVMAPTVTGVWLRRGTSR